MYPYIDFFGKPISTYGVCMVIAVALVTILTWLTARQKNAFDMDSLLIVVAVGLGFLLFGAYLLYIVVTYSAKDVLAHIADGDLSFLIPRGLVFYGGLLGGIVGVPVGAKIAKVRLRDLFEHFVPFIPLGHAVGRVGCHLAGCCYGMEYDGALAVYYKNSPAFDPSVGHFPVQLLEAVINIFIFFVLFYTAKRIRVKSGVLFLYLALYSVSRFALEFFRGDAYRGIFSNLSTSQWISILLFTASIIYFFLQKHKLLPLSGKTADN